MEGKKFSINITNARHELPLLKELLAAHNWEVIIHDLLITYLIFRKYTLKIKKQICNGCLH